MKLFNTHTLLTILLLTATLNSLSQSVSITGRIILFDNDTKHGHGIEGVRVSYQKNNESIARNPATTNRDGYFHIIAPDLNDASEYTLQILIPEYLEKMIPLFNQSDLKITLGKTQDLNLAFATHNYISKNRAALLHLLKNNHLQSDLYIKNGSTNLEETSTGQLIEELALRLSKSNIETSSPIINSAYQKLLLGDFAASENEINKNPIEHRIQQFKKNNQNITALKALIKSEEAIQISDLNEIKKSLLIKTAILVNKQEYDSIQYFIAEFNKISKFDFEIEMIRIYTFEASLNYLQASTFCKYTITQLSINFKPENVNSFFRSSLRVFANLIEYSKRGNFPYELEEQINSIKPLIEEPQYITDSHLIGVIFDYYVILCGHYAKKRDFIKSQYYSNALRKIEYNTSSDYGLENTITVALNSGMSYSEAGKFADAELQFGIGLRLLDDCLKQKDNFKLAEIAFVFCLNYSKHCESTKQSKKGDSILRIARNFLPSIYKKSQENGDYLTGKLLANTASIKHSESRCLEAKPVIDSLIKMRFKLYNINSIKYVEDLANAHRISGNNYICLNQISSALKDYSFALRCYESCVSTNPTKILPVYIDLSNSYFTYIESTGDFKLLKSELDKSIKFLTPFFSSNTIVDNNYLKYQNFITWRGGIQ